MRNLAIILVLAACGGSDSVAVANYSDAAHESFCRYLARCGGVENVETCLEINVGLTFRISASLQAAVEMGKVKYSADNAGSCLDGLAGQSCDLTSKSSREAPDACRKISSGTLHEGATCGLDAECISLFCDLPTTCDQACCTGSCIGDAAPPGPAALGQSCEAARCGPDSFCDDATLVCTALKPSGAGCAVLSECQYGLYCSSGGSCAALPGLGQPCTVGCRDDGTTCSAATGTCVKVGLVGAACITGDDCSPVYRCDATRHCARYVALGAPCTLNGAPCGDDGAFCDAPIGQGAGVCALPKADGMPCSRNAACDSLYCDPLTVTCAPEPVCI